MRWALETLDCTGPLVICQHACHNSESQARQRIRVSTWCGKEDDKISKVFQSAAFWWSSHPEAWSPSPGPSPSSRCSLVCFLPVQERLAIIFFWALDLGVKEPLAISISNRSNLVEKSYLTSRDGPQKFILDHISSPVDSNFKDHLILLWWQKRPIFREISAQNRDGFLNDKVLFDSFDNIWPLLSAIWWKPCPWGGCLGLSRTHLLWNRKRHLAETLTCLGTQSLHHLIKYDEAQRAFEVARSLFSFHLKSFTSKFTNYEQARPVQDFYSRPS